MKQGEELLTKIQTLTQDWLLVCRVGVGSEVKGEKSRAILKEDGTPLLYISDLAADGLMSSEKIARVASVVNPLFSFVELVDVGENCKIFNKSMARCYREGSGLTILVQPRSGKQVSVEEFSSYWLVTEDSLYPLIVENNEELIPLENFVVIKTERNNIVNGFEIAEDYEHISKTGIVIKLGPKCTPELKVGSKVLVDNEYHFTFLINGEWICAMPDSAIIGIIED